MTQSADINPQRTSHELPPAVVFAPGDKVVLAPYGVGSVCGTCLRPVAGHERLYYELSFPGVTARAYVPVASPQSAGLRAALTVGDLPRLLKCLQEGTLVLPRQWSARQRQLTEVLMSGDPFALATLIGELRRRNQERSLPDLDAQTFRRAIKLLEQETLELEGQAAQQLRALLMGALAEDGA